MNNIKAYRPLVLLILASLFLAVGLFLLSLPFKGYYNLAYWLFVLFYLVAAANVLAWAALFYFGKVGIGLTFAAASALTLLFFPYSWLQVVGALIVFLATLGMVRSIARNKKESLHFSFYHSVKRGMTIFFVALIALVSLNVYQATAENLRENPERFYQSMAEITVRSAQPFLAKNIDNFSPDMTLDDFLVRENYFDPQGFKRNEEGQVRSGRELGILRQQVLVFLGVEASGDDQLMAILRRIVTVRIKDLFQPVEAFIPFIYALLLFLSLRFLIPLMVWLSAGAGVLLFNLGVKAGLIRMIEKTVTVATPELNGG